MLTISLNMTIHIHDFYEHRFNDDKRINSDL